MRLINKFLLLSVLLACLGYGISVKAQGVEVGPVIIDEISVVRDIIEKTVEVRNNTAAKVSLYPFVNDVSQTGGKQAFNAYAPDKALALSNWIDFSRKTIELLPGATTSVPLKIQIHPLAKPGKYYANVSLINGTNRVDAESRLDNNTDSIITINIEVKENKVERLEIGNFGVKRFFNFDRQAELAFFANNSGNQILTPSGSVIIYDNRGREVSELKINESNKNISPDSGEPFVLKWSSGNQVGKFKAKLVLRYGKAVERDLQDSVYFWVLPKWFLGLVGSVILILFFSIMVLVLRLSRLKKSLNEDERSEIINLRKR